MSKDIRIAILEHQESCPVKITFEEFMTNHMPHVEIDLTKLKSDMKWIKIIGGYLVTIGTAQFFYVIWNIIFNK